MEVLFRRVCTANFHLRDAPATSGNAFDLNPLSSIGVSYGKLLT